MALFVAELSVVDEPKLNAGPPNAGGAAVLLFAPPLNVNGAFVSFVGAANVELLAAAFAV